MNTLALVVIARNEARCITRCLRSFAGHVDRMLVLDTGSTDDTAALARAAGAELRHFDWCDDFSAARNAALRAAGADWHLVVDADEWLDSGAEALAAWRLTPPHRLGLVDIRNTFDGPQGAGVATAAVARLLPGHVRYQGRIHEQPDTALPAARSGLRLLHDGYASAQKQGKAARNERLLQLALSEQPHDPYLLYQLGGELALRQDHTQAAGAYAQALQRAPARASYRGDLVRRMLVVLQALGEWGVAAELLEAELQRYAGSAYFMLTVGNVFWNWAEDQPAAAAAVLPMAEDAWQQALQLARGHADPADNELGHGLQLEQAGEHAALSLAALYRRRAQAGVMPAR